VQRDTHFFLACAGNEQAVLAEEACARGVHLEQRDVFTGSRELCSHETSQCTGTQNQCSHLRLPPAAARLSNSSRRASASRRMTRSPRARLQFSCCLLYTS